MKLDQLFDARRTVLAKVLVVEPAQHVKQVDDRCMADDIEWVMVTESGLAIDVAANIER